ncbi:MAG: hypothetical protein OXF99_01800 [bacterium]|nr:hypothetical protein [bacterium]
MKEIKENQGNMTEGVTQGMRVIHGDNGGQENSTGRCLAFAETVRQLGSAVRAQGLDMPSFRSPPREIGRRRTLARHTDGSVTVAVMVRNRLWVAVLADMIEGVVVANKLDGIDAEALRDQLWEALEGESAQREAA